MKRKLKLDDLFPRGCVFCDKTGRRPSTELGQKGNFCDCPLGKKLKELDESRLGYMQGRGAS